MTTENKNRPAGIADIELETQPFSLSDAVIQPLEGLVTVAQECRPLERKAMEVLVYLAGRPNELVAQNALVEAVWGKNYVGENPLYRPISLIRDALGDDKHKPRFIQTVSGKGYRLLVKPEPHQNASTAQERNRSHSPRIRNAVILTALISLLAGFYHFAMPGLQESKPSPQINTRHSLAVLPFKDLNTNGDTPLLGEGIAEEILILLGQLAEFELTSRATSFSFIDQTFDSNQIGEMLNVQYVLDGSVQRNDKQIYVRVHLAKTGSARQLWASSFEYEFESLVRAQSEIATKVAAALEVVLADGERNLLGQILTHSPEGYASYLEARRLLHGPREESRLLQAVDLFSDAVERDDKFERAFAGLCQAYVALFSTTQSANYYDQADKNCRDLAERNPALPEARIALGALYRERGEHQLSIRTLRAVVDAFPRNTVALTELGDAYLTADQIENARTTYQRAVEIAPHDYNTQSALAVFLFRQRDYQGATKHARLVTLLNPNNSRALNSFGATLYMIDDLEQAAAVWDRSIEIKPSRMALSNRGLAAYYRGEFQKSAQFQRRALELAPENHSVWGRLAESLRFIPGQETATQEAYELAALYAMKRLELNNEDADAYARLANYRVHLGDSRSMINLFYRAHEEGPESSDLYHVEALTWAAIGDIEQTLRCLQLAEQLGFSHRLLRNDPDLKRLMNHPLIKPFLDSLTD